MSTIAILLALSSAIDAAQREILLRRTFWAVAWVESGGDPRAVNVRERAVGIVQIRPIMLRDANRIIGKRKWRLSDRWNVEQSWQMFRVVMRYYYPKGGPEQWCRCWNGGPDGPRESATLPYWHKVQSALKTVAF